MNFAKSIFKCISGGTFKFPHIFDSLLLYILKSPAMVINLTIYTEMHKLSINEYSLRHCGQFTSFYDN